MVLGACLGLVVIGAALHIRSVQSGRGPSKWGVALPVLAGLLMTIAVTVIASRALVQAGYALALVGLIPFVLLAGVLALGLVRTIRR